MKNPSSYLKMRILGAVEQQKGNSIRERIKKTAKLTFIDEDGNTRRFNLADHLHLVLPVQNPWCDRRDIKEPV